MSKNLNSHIKSDKAKWAITSIVLLLIVIMLVGMCLQLFGQGKVKPSEWFKKEIVEPQPIEKPEQITENNAFDFKFENNEHILLAQGDVVASVAADDTKMLIVPLTATVLPEDATNKKVDWAITKQNGDEITSDYAVIEVDGEDGSNQVNVKILKSPISVLKVTVTTRDGGFQATAKISYYASPRSFTVGKGTGLVIVDSSGSTPSTTQYNFVKNGDRYDVPGYAETDTLAPVYTIRLDFKGFFDEDPYKSKIGEDCTFTFKFSDGTGIDSAHFECAPLNEYSTYSMVMFNFDTTFWQSYRSKAAINQNLCFVISVRNKVLNMDLGSIKVRFTVPVASVSTSETNIVV